MTRVRRVPALLRRNLSALALQPEWTAVLESARHWYRADTVSLSGGSLASLSNRGKGGGQLAVGAGTLAAPAADGSMKGAPSIVFSGTQHLVSSLPASEFRFLHDGTGKECFVVFRTGVAAYQSLLSTVTSGVAVGAQLYVNSNTTNCNLAHVINNGTAAVFSPNPTLAIGAIALNTAYCVENAYSEQSAPEAWLSANGATVASGASLAAPAVGVDPVRVLYVARSGYGDGYFTGAIADILLFDRVLSPYERQLVREYIQDRYGIEAPVWSAEDRPILKLNPFSWVRADYYATASGKVSAFLDKVLPGHSFAQGTAANQVANPVADALLNGQLSAEFISANATRYTSTLSASAWTFLQDGSGAEVLLTLVPTATTGQVWGTRYNSSASEIGYGSFRSGSTWYCSIGNGTPTPPLPNTSLAGNVTSGKATFVGTSFESAKTPNFQGYVRKVATASADIVSPVSFGSPQSSYTLGGRASGTSATSMRWADLLTFKRVLTSEERALVHQYMLSRYALS